MKSNQDQVQIMVVNQGSLTCAKEKLASLLTLALGICLSTSHAHTCPPKLQLGGGIHLHPPKCMLCDYLNHTDLEVRHLTACTWAQMEPIPVKALSIYQMW
ncbi:hypothetical protein BVC80_1737g21 [Macleaya cordata]|uniref:Uncharacterized protein n=1 Tax=Macleaya cordata TaxID=56857 RepID=A0A200Q862_MACCD|nr:hypothetical protein BVC80_1737g21 [Macleaya cordata]